MAAAYKATIKKSGTSTAFTDEAMSVVSGNTYKITASTKNVWDTSVVPTFYEDAVEIDSSDIASINYVFGKVTFATPKTGVITVDGSYMPLAAIAGANSIGLNMSQSIHNVTDFDGADNGNNRKICGQMDVTLSVERIDPLDDAIYDVLVAGNPIFIEINEDRSQTSVHRGWFLVESANKALNMEALINETISMSLAGQNDGADVKTFGYGAP